MTLPTIALLALAHFFITYPLYTLSHNYHAARKTNLRIIISPITPYTLQWQLAASLFGTILRRFTWFRALDWTSAWQDGDELHEVLGWNFIVVAPGFNVLCSSEPQTMEHVLRKWREFVKPDNVNGILGTFGQNVDTSNGDDWIRHRKLTAPCFSERASSTVWSTALQQSTSLLSTWLSPPSAKNTTLIKDTSTLTLNVISSVAFQNHAVSVPSAGHTLSLRESLLTVLSTNISPALEGLVPWLKKSGLQGLLPPSVKKLTLAMGEFRAYMDETVAREKMNPAPPAGDESKSLNLIRTLIKANDAMKGEDVGTGSKGRLSDGELRGNIFIFTIGGLEATAISLAYALAWLAVEPEVQAWVQEEVDGVFGDGEMEYGRCFPRLKRVMAVMYETLRIYGPSPPLPRSPYPANAIYDIPITFPSSSSTTSTSTNSPTTSTRTTLTLPRNTQLMLNSWAAQTSATHFPSPKTWDPKRWIQPSTTSSLTDEKLLHPTSESGFLAWGAGPRICPGMKFSQVEFTAVLASVLKRVRVGVVVEDEGGEKKAKERILRVLRESNAEPLLLHVTRPEDLWVRFEER